MLIKQLIKIMLGFILVMLGISILVVLMVILGFILMENHLKKVAIEKFGTGNFYIDKVQHEIPDHLHWHARPHGWKPRLRYRIRNKIRDLYRKCINTKQN